MDKIQAIYLLQLVHLDYLRIEMTEGGKDLHVLIITDHFMRYEQALVTLPQLQSVQSKPYGTDL